MTLESFLVLLETTDKPQCFSELKKGGAVCAIGLLASTMALGSLDSMEDAKYVEFNTVLDEFTARTGEFIVSLNDDRKMTFKQIAAFARERMNVATSIC